MTKTAQLAQLEREAYAAYYRSQYAHAALLFGQARALAVEIGAQTLAFSIGLREMYSLERSEGSLRYATLLTALLYEIPEGASPQDVYWINNNYLNYLTDYVMNPELDKIGSCLSDLESVAPSAGPAYVGQTSLWRASIANCRGLWLEAVTHCEISWSNPHLNSGNRNIPSEIIRSLLRLGKASDALRWTGRLSDQEAPQLAKIVADTSRILVALHDNDASNCRGVVLAVDDSIRGTEDAIILAEYNEFTALALVLDEALGDPLDSGHPSSLRLVEFSNKNTNKSSHVTNCLNVAAIILRIAGLRYAAGMNPVDDLYYRKPHKLQPPSAARLPDSISTRVATAREACNAALPLASHLDKGFQCTYRQDDITAWRARIDEIAAVYGF